MKIAILHFGRHGAGPVYSLEMAKALSAAGHEVVYYASTMVENRAIVEQAGFVYKFYDTYHSRITYLISIIFRHRIRLIIKDIKQEKVDVVYCPMNDLWTPFIFRKLKGYLRVKTIHDVGIHEGNDSIFNKIWNSTQFKDAEKFVILSKGFIPVLNDKGINPKDVQVIPHAGFDYYTKVGNEHHSKLGENVNNTLLFFGRIDKYKGLKILLAAMKSVIEHNPSITLFIAGNGDISEYRKQIGQLGNNVRIKNTWIPDNDVADIFCSASAVVLPYTHATQSGVIPLAYAFSKPVIATNVGCLKEQVVDGVTGYLVNGGDSDEIAQAILKMYDSPDEMKKMGENAHQYMMENLTWDASAKLLINFIK